MVEKCLTESDVKQVIQYEVQQQMTDRKRAGMYHDGEVVPMRLRYLEEATALAEGQSPVYDTTLRFTLSALWNLTDECPDACDVFVRVGGLLIYAAVLKVSSFALGLELCESQHSHLKWNSPAGGGLRSINLSQIRR